MLHFVRVMLYTSGFLFDSLTRADQSSLLVLLYIPKEKHLCGSKARAYLGFGARNGVFLVKSKEIKALTS